MKLSMLVLMIGFGLVQVCRGDVYEWEGGPSGVFSSKNWFDTTTTNHFVGPPGPNDIAGASFATLTFENGSVQQLAGDNATFDFEGPFNAGSLAGSPTVIGAGQLTAGSVSGFLTVNGGNLVAETLTTTQTKVQAGGSLMVQGFFTDHIDLECSSVGSSITANGGMTDVGLVVSAGGHVTAAEISNLLGSSSTFQDSGSLVEVSRSFELAEGATLDLGPGATLQVRGDLLLDGGTNFFWGGGGWSGPQTAVQVGGQFTVGDSAGGFSLAVSSGVSIQSGASYIGAGGSQGIMNVSGTNTVWEVTSPGLSVAYDSPGTLSLSTGANLILDSGTGLGCGFLAGSSGTITVDGPGTLIDARGAQVSIGKDSGSQGSLTVQNQASLLGGQDTFVGDGGLGTLGVYSASQVALLGNSFTFGIGHLAGGGGTVYVENGSTLTITGTSKIGDGGDGRLAVFAGTLCTAGTILGGTNGAYGSVTVASTNALWLESNQLSIASALVTTGTVAVSSQARLQVMGNCLVGDAGNGSLWVHSAGTAIFGSSFRNKFGVGNAAGSAGLVSVGDPGSSLNILSETILGPYGAGLVLVTNGATVTADLCELGATPGSSGSLSILGSGSAWAQGQSLFVGGSDQPAGTGAVLVAQGASLQVQPELFLSPSGVLTVDSSSRAAVGPGGFGPPGTLRVSSAGKLFGRGKVNANVIIGQLGIFAPGDSPGIFTIQGNYQQEAGGELDIVIGGNAPGTGFAQALVSGSATLGGTLNVYLINGFTPSPGQTFAILNASAVAGQFAQVNGAAINYGPAGVVLANVSGTTPPSPPALFIQRAPQGVTLSWPATPQPFTLQTTTDPSSSNWTDLLTASNSITFPISSPAAFFRLAHF